ncbi:MAG: hypothetical protein AAGE43_09745 [Pseudomonadota bacterium]
MPLTYKIDDGIVHVAVSGLIEAEQQMAFTREWLADPALPYPIRVLRDARREVLPEVGMLEMRDSIRLAKNLPNRGAIAFVVGDEMIRANARVYQALVGAHHDVGIFDDPAEARHWLLETELH